MLLSTLVARCLTSTHRFVVAIGDTVCIHCAPIRESSSRQLLTFLLQDLLIQAIGFLIHFPVAARSHWRRCFRADKPLRMTFRNLHLFCRARKSSQEPQTML